jgi:phosphohistidine phosphatase
MPKILYLVRHAKSSWDDPSLADKDRPLSPRGLSSAPEMGRRLAAQGHKPDLVISSPARRALATAKKIAKETGYSESKVITDDHLYFSGTRNMVDLLENLDDKYTKVMIVGHNPAMSSLLNILCDSSVENMPTCAVAVVSFDMASWSELSMSDGELLAYDYPKSSPNLQD